MTIEQFQEAIKIREDLVLLYRLRDKIQESNSVTFGIAHGSVPYPVTDTCGDLWKYLGDNTVNFNVNNMSKEYDGLISHAKDLFLAGILAEIRRKEKAFEAIGANE